MLLHGVQVQSLKVGSENVQDLLTTKWDPPTRGCSQLNSDVISHLDAESAGFWSVGTWAHSSGGTSFRMAEITRVRHRFVLPSSQASTIVLSH